MSASVAPASALPWWKEPTKDQWYAYLAAWGGWTLDAFDFTAFLLIMAPIAKEFGVPVSEVAAVLTITLWMRTAQKKQVVAFRTFLRTFLHEIGHHLDYELLRLAETFHTEGFYKRESSISNALLAQEARTLGGTGSAG